MGLMVVCTWLLLPILALSADSDGLVDVKDVVQDFWPDSVLGGVSLAGGQSQALGDPWPSTLMPLETLNFINLGSSLAMTLMDSSWTGPAESTTYPRGVPVYLQVSAVTLPDQEIYVQSCFASQSPEPSSKSRSALILNKGCATKQPVLKFVSRQSGFINLLLNTSSLKPSTLYLHCSVVLSRSAVTQTTKSCNFDQSNSSWVELGGQPGVCDCCASKCRGPPYVDGPFQDSKAIVSTGPLHIKEQGETQPSWSRTLSSTATSKSAASAISNGELLVAGTSSRVSVSGKSSRFSQPAEAMTSVSQNLGDSLPLLLPGIGLVQPNQILEIGISIPRMNSIATVDWSSPKSGQPERRISEAPSVESLLLKPQAIQFGDRNELHMSDAPASNGKVPHEELRGDVFMNYKWPQMENLWDGTDNSVEDFGIPVQRQTLPVKTMGEMVTAKVKDEFAKPDPLKRSKLTFIQASDGSSSLSYEAEERTLSMTEKGPEKTRPELAADGGNASMESPKKLEKAVQSLLDMLRGLNKMVTGH